MKHLFIASILFACAAATATAGDERMRLVHPRGTDLKLAQLQRENDLFAKFNGQVLVTGTFVGRWPAGASAQAYKTPDYVLVPDSASVARLPYFVLKEPPYFNSYRVRTIDLENGEVALRMAVGEVKAKQLLERKVNTVRVTGAFLIEAYVVGVECDAPWARAILVKVELPDQLAAAHRTIPDGC